MVSETPLGVEKTATARLFEPAGWRLSWGAVIAGVIVALVSQILLNILGIGVGAVSMNAAQADSDTAQTVGIVAAIWWAVSGIIAAGLGGWFAGRAMGGADKDDGLIHGLLSWAATTLIIAFFLTSVLGGALAGALSQLNIRELPGITQTQPGGQPGAAQSPGQAAENAAKQTTPEQRETAKKTVASSALASFVALILGAVAAAFAGSWGVVSARKTAIED